MVILSSIPGGTYIYYSKMCQHKIIRVRLRIIRKGAREKKRGQRERGRKDEGEEGEGQHHTPNHQCTCSGHLTLITVS